MSRPMALVAPYGVNGTPPPGRAVGLVIAACLALVSNPATSEARMRPGTALADGGHFWPTPPRRRSSLSSVLLIRA